MSVAILDYGAGNVRSVENAMSFLGAESVVTAESGPIRNATHVILPGVGAFGDAMGRIRQTGLDLVISECVQSCKPFLGICLGLQLLFEESEESPGVSGLGLLEGRIRRLPDGGGRKIPQIGWNDLKPRGSGRLFEGTDAEGAYVYFVHSYYLEARDDSIVTATAEYGTTIHASIESGNVFACQFHPEKSGSYGLSLLKNFLSM